MVSCRTFVRAIAFGILSNSFLFVNTFLKIFYLVFKPLYTLSGLCFTHNLSFFSIALASDFGILSNIPSFVNTFFQEISIFSAVLSPTQITLRFQSPSLKHRLSLFPPVCRALVYNTKSCCICQQLFTKILFFYNLLHFIVFIVF